MLTVLNPLLLRPKQAELPKAEAAGPKNRDLRGSRLSLPERGAPLTLMSAAVPADHEVLRRALPANNDGATHLLVEPERWHGLESNGFIR